MTDHIWTPPPSSSGKHVRAWQKWAGASFGLAAVAVAGGFLAWSFRFTFGNTNFSTSLAHYICNSSLGHYATAQEMPSVCGRVGLVYDLSIGAFVVAGLAAAAMVAFVVIGLSASDRTTPGS